MPRGAAPRCPPGPGRGPGFLWKKAGGKNTREEEVLPPWTHLFWLGGTLRGSSLFSAWPAALYLTPVTARPPAGRAGAGGFADGKGYSHAQSLPLGGRTVRGTVRSGPGEATINHRWAGEAGSDEGAILYPTFPCRKEGGYRLSPQRHFSFAPLGNPVAPSSVTFGDSFPPRGSLWVVLPHTKKRPKSGYVHGPRNSPTIAPLRPTTPKRASGNERVLNQGGRGHPPATLCVRAFSRESLDPRPGPGGQRGAAPRGFGKAPTTRRARLAEFPRPQAGKENPIMF